MLVWKYWFCLRLHVNEGGWGRGAHWLPCLVGGRRMREGAKMSGGPGADGAQPAAGWKLCEEAVR